MRKYLIIILSIFALTAHCQNPAAMAKSDSLFAAGVDLYNAGDFIEAILLFAESDLIDRAVLDSTSNRRDYSSMWLAACYYQLGDTVIAAELSDYYAYPVDRRLTVKSDSLAEIGQKYIQAKDYQSALPYLIECAEIEKQVLGDMHIMYGNSLVDISFCYAELNDFSATLKYLQDYAQIIEYNKGKQSVEYVRALNNMAYRYSALGNYSEAIRLDTEALEIQEKILGKSHPDYATSLNNLASDYSKLGNYSAAIRLNTEALEIREKILGKSHPGYATSLNNLASCYSKLGNYSEAIRLNTEALEIREKILGKSHPDYATSLNNLANDYSNLGNYSAAIRLNTEALEIKEKILGKSHPDYAASLNNLVVYYSDLGNYSEVIRLGTEVLEIREKILGKSHPDYAISLANLASYYSDLGNYSEAIRLSTEALRIIEKILGKSHPYYARLLDNLSSDYSKLGNYSAAIRLNTEALEINEKILGKSHPNYATSLNNLAGCYFKLDNYSEAIRLNTEALEIREKIYGKSHPDYALSLNNLALCYSDLGNYSEAIRLNTEALEIKEKILGKSHPDYALSLNNLASDISALGNYSEAVRLGTEALEIREKIQGKSHPDYALTMRLLAQFGLGAGRADQTIYYMTTATDLTTAQVKNTFADLTADGRNLFWNEHKWWFEKTTHQGCYRLPCDSLAANGYNSALMSKGLMLNSELAFSRLIQESGDTAALRLYDELRGYRTMANKLMEKMQTSTNTDSLRTIVDSLNVLADAVEKKLLAQSKVYGDYTHNLVITWPQVQAQLGKKDVAVEFVSFELDADSTIYVAYVLRKEGQPQMVPLFEEKTLTALSQKDKAGFDYGYCGTDAVSRLVWAPLEELLHGAKNVYFAAGGELHNIPVEALPDWERAGHFMNERYKFHRLSSTRELALIKDHNEWHDAAVYGGLRYDVEKEDLEANRDRYAVKERGIELSTMSANDENLGYNIADSIAVGRANRGLPQYLEGTKKEAVVIAMSLETAGIETQLYDDLLGTEASFKKLSGQRMNVMHIGTHGFFAPKRQVVQSGSDLERGLMANRTARYTEDYALTRSGLLFAGANFALSGNALPEGVENGILTANEISALDLRGLDLVVLSACQTGLGEVSGEGVFGLQRGFKKAGAQTLVMSLWSVSDTATELFMTRFFQNLSGLNMDKYAAFTEAQDYLRHYEMTVTQTAADGQPETRTVRPFDTPKYWSSFILLDAVD